MQPPPSQKSWIRPCTIFIITTSKNIGLDNNPQKTKFINNADEYQMNILQNNTLIVIIICLLQVVDIGVTIQVNKKRVKICPKNNTYVISKKYLRA